ncbi:MAG: GIY-YIG nuclease family protein [Myxococcota bacterium]|nr:GIY-YIG nuclease family protein [Myxococcota bacterium]
MTALSKKIEDKLKELPTQPGIYIFIDAKGKILYIGKAKNLKSRVTSYFRGGDTRYFVKLLGKVLQDIEIIVTNTEKEALLLENELIKKNKPKFNIKLVDDKHYL